jgi:hypothetical protein
VYSFIILLEFLILCFKQIGIRAPTGPEKKKAATFEKFAKQKRVREREMANDSNNNFIQPSIPRFDGHFDHWSMLMENFLRSKEF